MKKEHVTLTNDDRTYLQNLIKKGQLPARTYQRALALLELDRGRTFTEVASIVGVTQQAASTWATKYKESGLECLTDKPRPGRPATIDGLARAKITALACSDAPQGYDRWTLRLLADSLVSLEVIDAISYVAVGEVLKKMKLSPGK
ncbi:MAG: helix-turn-helix domain containing protein [Anaerolineaceae bacterium]|nr:helix-turn-helix domain containing protein [Anaerolineaceae bacterium]